MTMVDIAAAVGCVLFGLVLLALALMFAYRQGLADTAKQEREAQRAVAENLAWKKSRPERKAARRAAARARRLAKA